MKFYSTNQLASEDTRFSVLWAHAARLLCSVRVWWAICIVCAAVQAWANRYAMNPDGISYLDMASQTLKSGPHNLVNAHWSPAYPALISLIFMFLRPSPRSEFQVIHGLNFIIFLIVLGSFTFFFNSWMDARRADSSAVIKGESQFIPFGFGMFLWFMLEFVPLTLVTPDLCVAAIVFLIAGVCCRISISGSNWKYFFILGALLGLGYYVKTALFPLSFAVLALLFMRPVLGGRSRIRVIVAAAVFLAIASPLLVLMSKRVGHASIGEVGRMAWVWCIQGAWNEQTGWTGAIQYAHGSLQHPPRVLLENPAVFEFPKFQAVTNPHHYEPPYWFAGEKLQFDVRGGWIAFRQAFRSYAGMCVAFPALLSGLFVAMIMGVRLGKMPRPDRTCFWTLLWPMAACLMYGLVLVSPRYVGAFLVLFWLGLYGLFWQNLSGNIRIVIAAVVLGALFVPCTEHLLLHLIYPDQPTFMLAGERLRAAGVDPGARFATVGRIYDDSCVRYIAGHIVAEVDHAGEFWSLGAEDQAKVKKRLAGIGVRVILAEDRPPGATADGWRDFPSDSSADMARPRLSFLILDNIQGSASIQR